MRSEGFCVNEKSTDTSWDRTSDLPILISVPVINASIFLCGVDGSWIGAGGSFPGGKGAGA